MNASRNGMPEVYPEFFLRVTGNPVLPYQEEYGKNPFAHTLMIVPTGLGKTDSVLVPWLFAKAQNLPSPMRLILVEPRQNLTSQLAANARRRCDEAQLPHIRIIELMAGSKDNGEDLRPDEPAIVVCTQDMYFSRALNRGYARRPPRWPVDFALYNQDCVIVLDEIQLMDDALSTSTQLAAFREKFGVSGAAPCVWMSATVNPAWLRTIDFDLELRPIELSDTDRAQKLVNTRLHATKPIAKAPQSCRTPQGCAEFVVEQHRPGTRTLVLANTVARAREIFTVLRGEGAVLLHSRFRPADREAAYRKLQEMPAEGQIVVSTQVLEAGVDITSRLLVTDIAPWGSLVQRFGRVNRYGDDGDAEIYWVDEPTQKKQGKNPFAPYNEDEIKRASERIQGLTSAAPADLPQDDGPAPWKHVLRRSDLLDLFDTSPDLTGNEMDVSRFIRATDDKDVYLAWRDWPRGQAPDENAPELVDAELCPVPIGELREFVKKHEVYTWDFALDQWERVDKERPLFPGMLLLTRSQEGGYTKEQGWMADSTAPVHPVDTDPEEIDGSTADRDSWQKYEQRLRDHTRRVVEEADALLTRFPLPEEYAQAVRTAAQKHDWGKAHEIFQETMHRCSSDPELLAKIKGSCRHRIRHFRHELASALAMLKAEDSDLTAYLVAAHHGKIRMSIRSMPGEKDEHGRRRARGITDGDRLQAIAELAPGLSVPQVELSLDPMEFGAEGSSWTARVVQLLDDLGPFRLAYLEMLLRSADMIASGDPRVEVAACTN
jgi:CRISPR-associated endonuclease/helicase Cas3